MSPNLTGIGNEDPIYFWRETETPYGFLSQWHTAPFIQDSPSHLKSGEAITFLTAEQYMMYYKAVTFNDHGSATKIIEESSPRKQKSLGRKVANFDGKLWDSVKQQIVEDGNYLKFTQAKDDPAELAAALLATGERLLVEASPFDRVWGVGFSAVEASANKDMWGQNLLGEALMRVRKRLQDEKTGKGSKAEEGDL